MRTIKALQVGDTVSMSARPSPQTTTPASYYGVVESIDLKAQTLTLKMERDVYATIHDRNTAVDAKKDVVVDTIEYSNGFTFRQIESIHKH